MHVNFLSTCIKSTLLSPVYRLSVSLLCYQVLGITSDGASTNRKFYRLASSLPSIPYKAPNFFTWNNRFLYLFCDVPHLMKTVRNCWASSYVAGKKRKMWVRECYNTPLPCMHFQSALCIIHFYRLMGVR